MRRHRIRRHDAAELITARDDCGAPLPAERDLGTPRQLRVDLGALAPGEETALFVDTGNAGARRATFALRTAAGRSRLREIARHPDQVTTGRFYLPLETAGPDPVADVTITLDVTPGTEVEVRACRR